MLNSTKQFTSDHTDSPTKCGIIPTPLFIVLPVCALIRTHAVILLGPPEFDCSGTNCMGIIIFVDKPSTLPSCELLKHVPITAGQEEFIAVRRRADCFSRRHARPGKISVICATSAREVTLERRRHAQT